MNKDLQLARHELKRLGLDFPLAEAVIKVYQEAVHKGLGEEDWSAIAKLLEQESGVRIR